MKHPGLLLSACMVLIVAALFAAGCTSTSPGSTIKGPPPVTPGVTPGQSSCGFTTCHGLDLACGMNGPDICTTEYRLGDKCRQYAKCTSGSDGTCTLVTSPEFDSCKSCVETCENTIINDPQQAFACEAKC